MTSDTSLSASLSRIHSSNDLLTMGKSVLGLVQLSGLSRVPNPPARITAFNWSHFCPRCNELFCLFNINSIESVASFPLYRCWRFVCYIVDNAGDFKDFISYPC